MRKWPRLFGILWLAILLPLGGCWDRTEAEKLNIVLGAAIDRLPDGQFRVICQTVSQSTRQAAGQAGGRVSSSTSYHNWSSTGSTLLDAVRRMTLSAPYRLYWSHCQVIVVSERLARQDITSILDFLEREAEVKRSLWLLIAREAPERIMEAGSFNNLPPATLLAQSINIRERNSWYPVSRLNQFTRHLGTPGREAYTAGVASTSGLIRRDIQSAGTGPHLREPQIAQTALFQGRRLVGWLDERQSRGLLWLLGEVKGGIVPVQMDGKTISFEVLHSSSKIEPVVQDGELKINLAIKVDANIGEVTPGLDRLDSAAIARLEAALSEHVRQDIAAALAAMQSVGSDAAGLGETVYRRFPEQWRQHYASNWPEIFSALDCTIAVQGKVRGLGRISTSPRSL